jgi:hypothetical protein
METMDTRQTGQFKRNISNYANEIDVDLLLEHRFGNKTKSNKSKSNTIISNPPTSTWNWNEYVITSSLTSDDNIYINVMNNKTFQTWEKNICAYDLNDSGLSIQMFHTILAKSFEQTNPSYSFQFELNRTKLTIIFDAILDGFFPISQSIDLDEKIISGDKTLTLKLGQIESNYQNQIDVLKKRIEELENEPIVFAVHPTEFGKTISCTISSKEFDFRGSSGFELLGNYMDFNKLKGLKKIIMYGNQFKYWRTMRDINYCSNNNLPDGVNIIYTQYSSQYCYLSNLKNIFDTPYISLPNVTTLDVHFIDGSVFPTNALRSIPNLARLSFYQWGNTQIYSFELIKSTPKLSHLVYSNCLNIANLDQIKNWCDSKNIKLEIK